MNDVFCGESILSEMPSVIEWLVNFGFRALSSRFSRYTKYIDDYFEKPYPTSEAGRDRFEKLTRAYHECLNILIIKTVFEDEKSDGFKDKLCKVTTGPDFLFNSPNEESRNYLFELLVSARFAKCDYNINFNSETDVIAEKDGLTLYVECKRIFSEKSFEKNFKEAGKQLMSRNIKITEKDFGLIFIDVTNCINADLPCNEVENSKSVKNVLDKAMIQFIERQSSLIDSLNERFSGESLAVCLFGQGSIWTKDPHLYLATTIAIRARISMEDAEFNVLNSLLTE